MVAVIGIGVSASSAPGRFPHDLAPELVVPVARDVLPHGAFDFDQPARHPDHRGLGSLREPRQKAQSGVGVVRSNRSTNLRDHGAMHVVTAAAADSSPSSALSARISTAPTVPGDYVRLGGKRLPSRWQRPQVDNDWHIRRPSQRTGRGPCDGPN